MSLRTKLEDALLYQIKLAGLPEPEREAMFARPRKWRLDFFWPRQRLAVEVEGGVWIQGRHNRGAGMIADMAKYNEAALRGIRVLRVAAEHIRSGVALNWITTALSRETA